MCQGPLLGRPAGERRSQHELSGWQAALGTAGWDGKNRRTVADGAGGGSQIEIGIHYVHRGAGDSMPVEERGRPFADLAGVKTVDTTGLGCHAYQGGLEQPLK